MNIALDIRHVDAVVQRRSIGFSIANKFFNWIDGLFNRLTDSYIKSLDKLILITDGYKVHIKDLPSEILASEQVELRSLAKRLEKLDNKMYDIDYADNIQLKQTFRYLIKNIHQIEAKIHKRINEDINIDKVDSDMSTLISRLSKNNIQESL